MYINTLIVRFKNKLYPSEIPLFRGAVIDAVGQEGHVLFHDHGETGFRYRYPLIQYKRIGGQAAIVCVGEGCEEMGALFSKGQFQLRLGDKRSEYFEVERVQPRRTMMKVWDDGFDYYLRNWLPLNSENYRKYQHTDAMTDKLQLLEQVLVGNILSACKGVGEHVEGEIRCKILHIEDPRKTYYKKVPWMSFDVVFRSNVSLPDYVGLGKGVSVGHGVVARKRKSNNESNNDNTQD